MMMIWLMWVTELFALKYGNKIGMIVLVQLHIMMGSLKVEHSMPLVILDWKGSLAKQPIKVTFSKCSGRPKKLFGLRSFWHWSPVVSANYDKMVALY
jgi:hypothetical protein